ncbi:Imm52 family immunity protein [uncultured Litoreibacter sp.]|uniref:Imm52 family immunity protein n=1 Tax=uncultured Litoreibacter sp. TaxID=1392394 RepID=UPI0026243BE8|nr:Imm52 family immunity protein [uncultured Litoreibacter sp.]
MRIDLTVAAIYPEIDLSLEGGVTAFTSLLDALSHSKLCDGGWFTATPSEEGDASFIDPLQDAPAAAKWFAKREEMILDGRPRVGPRNIYAAGPRPQGPSAPPPEADRYKAEFSWDSGWGTSGLALEFYAPHPNYGIDAAMVLEVIDKIIAWRRPQHVAARPAAYHRDHHPLDRQREQLGWVGWVPFEIGVEDIPEAAALQLMHGGTGVIGQHAFWRADDATAVANAQALDLRLNSLGVLPTSVELTRGDWGQGG